MRFDHRKRSAFVNWIKGYPEDFSQKFIISEGVHLKIGDFVNKQIARIQGEKNPQVIYGRSLHSELFGAHYG